MSQTIKRPPIPHVSRVSREAKASELMEELLALAANKKPG